jgi:hypothetical protein
VKNEPANMIEALVNDILELLGVKANDTTTEEKQRNADSWALFVISNYRLTIPEIKSAYVMALTSALKDEDGKNIKLFPHLSNIEAAKVLNAYQEWKKQNAQHNNGRCKLNRLLNPPIEPSKQQELGIMVASWKRLLDEVKNSVWYMGAFVHYDKVKQLGYLKDVPRAWFEERLERKKQRLALQHARKEKSTFISSKEAKAILSNSVGALAIIDLNFKNLAIQEVKNDIVLMIVKKYYSDFEDYLHQLEQQLHQLQDETK